jgi:adenylosuccinate synthase
LSDSTGERLRERGHEYGATTGRPRRCGWLDLPALKYAIMINGVTRLFMTKSDVLSGFGTIKVCRSYIRGNKESMEVLADSNIETGLIYEEFDGWSEDISRIREFSQLPASLRRYIEYIEQETGIPVSLVSVGPGRNETIFR